MATSSNELQDHDFEVANVGDTIKRLLLNLDEQLQAE
jgi:hypothetical protein